jgi:hypothetical protein
MRIIVTGMVGLFPVGGVAWDYLQYVIGLAQLGHEVYYHEDTWSWPYNPVEKAHTSDGTYSAVYLSEYFARYAPDLSNRWHYLHLNETSFGMKRAEFDHLAQTADVFLNVSGACLIPRELSSSCLKVFLDTDPGYNQIMLSERFAWSENVARWCDSVAAHDVHFTYAENIHGPACTIPKLEFAWKTTRMPVVLDLWEPLVRSAPPTGAPWTTVMTWNAFKGKLIYDGIEYKSKGAEFEKIIDLPNKVSVPLKIGVGGINAPLERLAASNWQVIDGPSATVTPAQYQEFIATSRGEISTAKNVYVATHSGWFSCRSACYLAAGRPVIIQNTGFTGAFPTTEGIISFETVDEALEALLKAERDYTRHAVAARRIAVEHFDSNKVLQQLLNDALG